MGQFPVVPERFAVIGGDDGQCWTLTTGGGALEQRAERVVGVGDLPVMRARRIPLVEGWGWPVDGVGIVQMHPREPATRLLLDPRASGCDHRLGGALRNREVGWALGMSEPIVVEVEATVEAELAVERKGGHERGCGEPFGAEHAGDGARVVR